MVKLQFPLSSWASEIGLLKRLLARKANASIHFSSPAWLGISPLASWQRCRMELHVLATLAKIWWSSFCQCSYIFLQTNISQQCQMFSIHLNSIHNPKSSHPQHPILPAFACGWLLSFKKAVKLTFEPAWILIGSELFLSAQWLGWEAVWFLQLGILVSRNVIPPKHLVSTICSTSLQSVSIQPLSWLSGYLPTCTAAGVCAWLKKTSCG